MNQQAGGQGRKKSQTEQQNEKRLKKNEEDLRELKYNMKHNNIHILGISEGEEGEQGIENLLEKVMTENFPNLMTEKNHTSTGSAEGPNQDESK